MRLIEQADPPAQATVEIGADLSTDAINHMGLSELLAVAERLGISLEREDSTPPATPPALEA
jgi:hypothetical protein